VCDRDKAATAPFCITGEYSQWKQVLLKELDPIKGMMQGKLKLKGDLPTIVRYVKAAQELVNAASRVDTEFLD
jgi:putative sterol carrier protein